MPRISLGFVNLCDDGGGIQITISYPYHRLFPFEVSYGFKLPCDGVKIVTYGEPCHPPRYLPVTIEEPVKPVTELVLPKPCAYPPLKLNYRVISTEPIPYQPRAEYPISIQVPQVPQPLEIITPDPLRGKSYTYNIQAIPPPSVPISTKYDCDFQVPPSPIQRYQPHSPLNF